eukprot:gb/GECH01009701.1/.p1 GENE.gb/GECH01009701.1/~~gb/GECH01009701.1/.p1  ORF type:complete len:190 (+),score=21.38 gb/GECH01009701.1/:1-570(+)
MPGEDHKLGPLSHLSCGALSGLLSDGLVHPLDTIRTRLQIERSHLQQEYKSSVDVFRKMLKLEGPRSLYKGFTAVAIGTIPGHAFYFMGYEASKKYLAWMTGSKHEEGGPLVHLTSGLMADVFGGLVWVPMVCFVFQQHKQPILLLKKKDFEVFILVSELPLLHLVLLLLYILWRMNNLSDMHEYIIIK